MRRLLGLGILLALLTVAATLTTARAVTTASGPRLICNYIKPNGTPVVTPCPSPTVSIQTVYVTVTPSSGPYSSPTPTVSPSIQLASVRPPQTGSQEGRPGYWSVGIVAALLGALAALARIWVVRSRRD